MESLAENIKLKAPELKVPWLSPMEIKEEQKQMDIEADEQLRKDFIARETQSLIKVERT